MGTTHQHNEDSEKRIGIAFITNLVFTIIEFIGGIYTNSIAIITDAVHDFGDTLSLGLAYILEKFSKKKHKRFSYGLKRLSLLSSIILGVSLFTASVFVLKEAISRLISPEPVMEEGMIVLAIIGIIANGYAFFLTQKGKTFNERMVSLHMLEDVLGWIGVLIVAIITYITKIEYLDAILSIIFVGVILYNIFKNVKESAYIFLQAVPKEKSIEEIRKVLLDIEGVIDAHDIHIWSLDGSKNIMTVHITTTHSEVEEIEKMKKNIKEKMKNEGIEHTTIEVDIANIKKCEDKCN